MSSTTQGTRWTEADYSVRGTVQLKLRLDQATVNELGEIAEAWGCSRAEAVRRLVAGRRKPRISAGSKKSTRR